MTALRGLKTFLAIIGLVCVLGLSGCWPDDHVGAPGMVAATPNPPKCVPVKVALLQDQTGSTSWTRTPQFTSDDLKPMVELVRTCGGEIGFGLIRDESNRSLVRVSTQPAPQRTAEPSDSNPFRAAKLRNAPSYQQELARYQEKSQEWQTSTDSAISAFMSAATSLLRQPKLAKSTDIWGAVQRANAFLSEDDAVWKTETHRWAIFVTDGLHNTSTREAALSKKTRVIVVNASNEIGVLSRFNPSRFESATAALRYVIAEETQKK